jgi:hypothetical protein
MRNRALPQWLSRRGGKVTAAYTVNAVIVAALVVAAATTTGYTVHKTALNDGGLWVVNDHDGVVGRFNKPVGQLDAAITVPGASQAKYTLEVLQDQHSVVQWDQADSKLYPVDVAAAKPIATAAVTLQLPNSSNDFTVEAGGGSIAVLERSTGSLWAVRSGTGVPDLAPLDSGTKPLAKVGAASDLAVANNGTVYVASAANSKVVTVSVAGAAFAKPSTSSLPAGFSKLLLTTVGSSLVGLDPTTGTLFRSGGTVSFPDLKDATLQQPGPAAGEVIAATGHALYSIPLSGASPRVIFDHAAGKPAAPVRIGACVHEAWTGIPGLYVKACGGTDAQQLSLGQDSSELTTPVFRVNWQQVVLNDSASGGVWLVDDQPKRSDNWKTVEPTQTAGTGDGAGQPKQNKPPIAVDMTQGARPGRTTTVHVLDNDSDPSGGILAVTSAGPADVGGVGVSIAADAQSVLVSLPEGFNRDVHFTYMIANEAGASAHARVTVTPRPLNTNIPPNLRSGAPPITASVAENSTITLPVLNDWRDQDGDPVALVAGKPQSGQGSATPTGDGRLLFASPSTPGVQTVTYSVSDGIGPPVISTATVSVLAASDLPLPAQPKPDVARGVVNTPILIHPLDNDLPGADPTNPQAQLALAGEPTGVQPGSTATADRRKGTITFTAIHPATYILTYGATFGAAATAAGQIRIDIQPDPSTTLPPVAVPDTLTVHGSTPGIVDVLANDFDPAGRVLAVTGAAPVTAGNLAIGVVQRHWLRIGALSGSPGHPQIVRYTISDGVAAPVVGEVTVTQLPDEPSAAPVPQDDAATVRAGDVVDIPVLDNDTDPNGGPLTLVPAALPVTPATVGHASVNGIQVRYAPPVSIANQQQVQIDYVVRNLAGQTATGHAFITIIPIDPTHDQPPAPPVITVSVVAGDTLTIPVPTVGADPDGDSAAFVGLSSAPSLGLISATTPSSLTYQSFPLAAGTDTFSYQVEDPFGLVGESTIRVGVVPPGRTSPPVAVDDQVVAAPESTVQIDVAANDLIDPDDTATVEPLTATNHPVPTGTSLNGSVITVVTPPANGRPVVISYGLTDGSSPTSIAQLTVRGQDSLALPPIARDDQAKLVPGAANVTVAALANDTDSDGTTTGLNIVSSSDGTTEGATVTLPVKPFPRAVPYQVVNRIGATAIGVIHIPGSAPLAGPALKPGLQPLAVPRSGQLTVHLSDVAVDGAAKPLRLTLQSRVSAGPTNGLTASSQDDTTLVLRGAGAYEGPAEVSFEVTDGSKLGDTGAHIALLTVPVQVGSPVPVIRCPGDPLTVVEGGTQLSLDVVSQCHIWVSDPSSIGHLTLDEHWKTPLTGVNLSSTNSGHTLAIKAGGGAKPGDSGQIVVSAPGTDATSLLTLKVISVPPPVVKPITLNGAKAGETASVDVAPYVTSQLSDPIVTVVSVVQTSTIGLATASTAKGSIVTFTLSPDAKGTMTFNTTVTDVADVARADRRVQGQITLNVLGHPDAPTNVVVQAFTTHQVTIGWTAPPDNGAPIDHFTVKDSQGGSRPCPASPCAINGLQNGTAYTFTVSAHNAIGDSKGSAPSGQGTPDSVPTPVNGFTATPGDMQVGLSWSGATGDFTAVLNYRVTISPAPATGGVMSVSGTSTTVGGLDNHQQYSFAIEAMNKTGYSTAASVSMQPYGKPTTVGKPTAAGADSANRHEKAVTVTWAAPDGNGRPITSYTVTEYKGAGQVTTTTPTPSNATTTTFSGLTNDGSVYTFTVVATNAGGPSPAPPLSSAPSAPSNSISATSQPDQVTGVSAQDHDSGSTHGYNGSIKVSFTAPNPNSTQVAKINYNASGVTGTWNGPFSTGQAVTQSIGNLSNGGSYSVTVSACNDAGLCGPSSPGSNTVSPYGDPPTPQASAGASGTTVNFSWSWTTNGRPVTIFTNIDNEGFVNRGQSGGPGSGSDSRNVGYNMSGTIQVYAVDSAGTQTATAPANATTGPPPTTTTQPPSASITGSVGGVVNPPVGSCDANCHWLSFQVHNFTPGQYYWTCNYQQGGPYNSTVKVTISDPNQTFNSAHLCAAEHQWQEITINNITSDQVPMP